MQGVDAQRQRLAAQQAELVDRLEAAAAGDSSGDAEDSGSNASSTAARMGPVLHAALADCRAVAAAEQQGIDDRLSALQQQVYLRPSR